MRRGNDVSSPLARLRPVRVVHVVVLAEDEAVTLERRVYGAPLPPSPNEVGGDTNNNRADQRPQPR